MPFCLKFNIFGEKNFLDVYIMVGWSKGRIEDTTQNIQRGLFDDCCAKVQKRFKTRLIFCAPNCFMMHLLAMIKG